MYNVSRCRVPISLALILMTSLAKSATEAEVRAALIFNIARFVEWPIAWSNEQLPAPHFDVCTLGNSAVADALTSFEGKPFNGTSTSIRSIAHHRDLTGCHVLYIAPDHTQRISAITKTLASTHQATLTISDTLSFLVHGGMVQLLVLEKRQRFRINQDLVEKADLSLNAKLLQLALPGWD